MKNLREEIFKILDDNIEVIDGMVDKDCYRGAIEDISKLINLDEAMQEAESPENLLGEVRLTKDELNLIRQWYNAANDLNPKFMDREDIQSNY